MRVGRGRPAQRNHTEEREHSARPHAAVVYTVRGPSGDLVELGALPWLYLRALQTSPTKPATREEAHAYLGTLAEGFPLRVREIAVNAFVAGYEAI